jgi:hypothetical protein
VASRLAAPLGFEYVRHDGSRRVRAPDRYPFARKRPARVGDSAPATNSSSALTVCPASSPPTAGPPAILSPWISAFYAALKSRKVDLIAANSTDGLPQLDVAAQDDLRYFPPYEMRLSRAKTWRARQACRRRRRTVRKFPTP